MTNLPAAAAGPIRKLAQKYRNELGLLLAIVLVVGVTATFRDSYRQKPGQNAVEILRQTALLGTFALGAAIVIISGGIDLSSGSVIAFSASVTGAILYLLAPLDEAGNPSTKMLGPGIVAVAMAGTMLSGFLIGTLHAWLITIIELPPFVATLASLVGLRSLARLFVQKVTSTPLKSGTTQIYIHDPTFGMLGTVWWIPLGVFLVLSLLAWLLMSRTVVGRHLYAMGGNEAAARLSGIRTDRLKWLAYSIGAMTSSIAGFLYCAEATTADPSTQGSGYELNAIAAAVVGGCSLQGGVGSIPGTMLGVLFLRVVIDAVAKMVKGDADVWEGIIVGTLVVLAVAFNALRQARGAERKRFFPGVLGAVTIVILALLAGGLATLMVGQQAGEIALSAALILLGLVKALESRRTRRAAQTSPAVASSGSS